MSLITDKEYNDLEWKTITINQLKEIVNGATVLESYAINEPFIDGGELVIKKADGKIAIVSFNADSPDPKNIDADLFYIEMALVNDTV